MVEMLVVVTISAVLAMVGVPMYTQTLASYRLDSEVNALVGDLQYARSEAIKQGTTVVMCVSTNLTSSSPSCTSNSSNNNWAAGHLVAVNPPSQTGTTGTSIQLPVLRQLTAFSGSDTVYGQFVGGGNNVTAIQFNRDGFAGTPSTTTWNGFSSLTANVFLKVKPATNLPGAGKCIAISVVGQIQVVPINGYDNSNDQCS
jgi:type IV fimbrial biogenesis protein FimT